MAEKKVLKPVTLAVGAALAGSFALAGTVNAADTSASPFEMSGLQVGYMVDETGGEGSCGEGSCGESDEKEGEGSCGEGSCGESDEKEGEGSCGESS
jgi:uncharacterized low-complexity protein